MSFDPILKQDLPARDYFAITTSDTVNFSQGEAMGIYVGVAGDVVAVSPQGNAVTFKAVPVGILRVQAIRVNSTSTTATNLVGLLA